MEKLKLKNGFVVNGWMYQRIFDFNRDSLEQLIAKLGWCNNEKSVYVALIEQKLKQRIEKGCYSYTVVKNRIKRKTNINVTETLKRLKK